MNLTRTRYESGVGSSLLSARDSEALRTVMQGSAIPVKLPGAAGRLALVQFEEGTWPVWSGVHMPLCHNNGGPLHERDVYYEWRGGSFDIALTGTKFLSFGGHAEFAELTNGGIDVISLPAADCELCPPGEARETLSERLASDAERFGQDCPAVAPNMRFLAGNAAQEWPFEDLVLRTAVDMILHGLGYQTQP